MVAKRNTYNKKEHEIGKSDCNGQVPRDGCETAAIVGSEANNYGADNFVVSYSKARFSTEAKPYVSDIFEPDDDELPDEN